MEAKDTVMSFLRIVEIDNKNATGKSTDALYDVAREQSSISFGLGMEKVIDWVRSHPLIAPDPDSITMFEPFYEIEESELRTMRRIAYDR